MNQKCIKPLLPVFVMLNLVQPNSVLSSNLSHSNLFRFFCDSPFLFGFCLLLLVVGVLIGVGDFGGGGNVGLGVKAAVKSSI